MNAAGAPAPELIEAGFAYEIAGAGILHEGLNLADMAHLLQQHGHGIVPDDDAVALAAVLLEADSVEADRFGYDAAAGEP